VAPLAEDSRLDPRPKLALPGIGQVIAIRAQYICRRKSESLFKELQAELKELFRARGAATNYAASIYRMIVASRNAVLIGRMKSPFIS